MRGIRGEIIVRVLLAVALALAGHALAQATPLPPLKHGKPHAEATKDAAKANAKVADTKPVEKKPATESTPKTVQLGEPAPQSRPPRPISPQTPPPARPSRAASAEHVIVPIPGATAAKPSGAVAVAPIPQATSRTAPPAPKDQAKTSQPPKKPAAAKTAKPAPHGQRAALTPQKQTGGR
jgi:hypothetical protein